MDLSRISSYGGFFEELARNHQNLDKLRMCRYRTVTRSRWADAMIICGIFFINNKTHLSPVAPLSIAFNSTENFCLPVDDRTEAARQVSRLVSSFGIHKSSIIILLFYLSTDKCLTRTTLFLRWFLLRKIIHNIEQNSYKSSLLIL